MGLLFLFMLPHNSSATHVMGSDIHWEAIGNDTLKVTVSVYRDCNGIALSATRLTASTKCGTQSISTTLTKIGDVTPVCSNVKTRCDSRSTSFQYGIEKLELTGIMVVSSLRSKGCCELTITWGQCCRNGAITTGAANNNFYVDALVDICNGNLDNSPKFKNDPLAIICLGRDYVFSHGAIDPDGDSLAYAFVAPKQTATSASTWSSPYSYDKPIYFLGFPKTNLKFPRGLHLDANTGDLRFRPMKEEVTVMVVEIKSYRNGKLIGRTRRDIQTIVTKCADNYAPVLSGSDCGKPRDEDFVIYACEGQELKFTVCAYDADSTDSITVNHFTDVNGYKLNGQYLSNNRWEGEFSWKPNVSQVRGQPYIFNLYVNDSKCPVPSIANRTFRIFVQKDIPTTITPQLLTKSKCNVVAFDAKLSSPVPATSWEWYENDSLVGTTQSGTYFSSMVGKQKIKVIARRNGCKYSAIDSIVLDSSRQVILPILDDTVLCAEPEIEIDLSGNAGMGGISFIYGFDTTSYSGRDSVKSFTIPDNSKPFAFKYGLTDGNCTWQRSFTVINKENRSVDFQPDFTLCDKGAIVNLNLYKSSIGGWTGPGVSRDRFVSDYTTLVKNHIAFAYDDSNYCIIDSAIATANGHLPRPQNDTFRTCLNHDSIPLPHPYTSAMWSGSGVINNQYFYKPGTAAAIPLKCAYDLDSICSDSFEMFVLIENRNITVNGGDIDTLCRDSLNSQYCLRPVTPGGTWKGPGITSSSNGCINPGLITAGAKTYTYTLVDSQFCKASDAVSVFVGEAVAAGFSSPKTWGPPALKVNFTNQSEGKYANSYWSFGDPFNSTSTAENPQFTYSDTGQFDVTLLVKDSTGFCEDRLVKSGYILVSNNTSIGRVEGNDLELYPNPAQNTLNLGNLPENTSSITIYTADGRLSKILDKPKVAQAIDISAIGNGTYLIKVVTTDAVYLQQFSIVR